MLIQDKLELKFNRMKEQFGCGYYSICCRNACPCKYKYQKFNLHMMKAFKKEFDRVTVKLFDS